MADSNSQSQRCQCGFWGTPQTAGLCSKCYKDLEKKNAVADGTSGTVGGASAFPAVDLNTPLEQAMSSSSIEDTGSSVIDKAVPIPEEAKSTNGSKATDDSEDTTDKKDQAEGQDSSSENGGATKRDISEVQDATESELPVQKNKKRCFKCKCKLELAIREIGRCKCNFVFCQLHRLPEQHDCVFDHKGKGRKEARDKMVSPKKHAGTSIKRMDSCS